MATSQKQAAEATAETIPQRLWRGDILHVDHASVRVPDLELGLEWYKKF